VVCNCTTTEGFSYCCPACRDGDLVQQYSEKLSKDIDLLKKELNSKSMDYSQCIAHGCSNVVFREAGRDFDYCLPQCRDSHLLEEYNSRLTADIDKMKSDLSNLDPELKGIGTGALLVKCLCGLSTC